MESATHSPSDMFSVIFYVLLFFGIAGVVVPLLQRLHISPILGYLIAGIAIGPYGYASWAGGHEWLQMFTIKNTETVHILGELGIVSLMFMIGLELSIDRLRELKHYIFGLGSAQIIATATLVFLIARFFDHSLEASIILGSAFALSSTAIVMKLLEERHLTNRPVGVLSFSILLMQDLAVVPILVLATSFGGESDHGVLENIVISLGIGIAAVLAIFFLGQRVLKTLLQYTGVSHNAEWLSAFAAFVVIGCSALTLSAGLSLALGAFLAGLLIAETEFRHEVEIIFSPVKGMLLGIFFLSIGMMIDVREFFLAPHILLAAVLGLFLVKSSVLFPLCLMFKVPKKKAFQTSLFLAQPGEFALLLLGVAAASQLISQHDMQFFYLVTVVSMMLSPALFKIAPFLSAKLFPEKAEEAPAGDFYEEKEDIVIIAGMGRVGQLLASALQSCHINYIGFDLNATKVMALKQLGHHIIYGDARKIELWQGLNKGNIIAIVIAIDKHESVASMIKALRMEWPLVPVIVRAQDTANMGLYYDLGAKHVVAETLESSLSMARLVMLEAGKDESDSEKIIDKIREKNELQLFEDKN